MLRRLIGSDEWFSIAVDYRAALHETKDALDRRTDQAERLLAMCRSLRSENETLRAEKACNDLEQARWARNVIEQFLIVLDRPEVDVREALIIGLNDMRDEVARLEEHATA